MIYSLQSVLVIPGDVIQLNISTVLNLGQTVRDFKVEYICLTTQTLVQLRYFREK